MVDNWRIWNRDDSTELRTYQRATGKLPEMQSAKQLARLVKEVYAPGMSVLDVGCAAGHYYRSLQQVDRDVRYTGIDPTTKYLEYAKSTFRDTAATFLVGDVFALSETVSTPFDIVFCCNVLLHLPDFRVPIQNLLKATKRHCFVRTLIGERTVIAQHVVGDNFDKNGVPVSVNYFNTYSFNLLNQFIRSVGNYEVELINDAFDSSEIDKEFVAFRSQQPSATRVVDGYQVSGNLVFQWAWLKITTSK